MRTCMLARLCFVSFLALRASSALAWDYGRPIDIRSEEELLELYYQGELSEEELERLQALLKRPLNPATASAERLADLPGISLPLAKALAEYARTHPIQRIEDLLTVPGFSHELLDQARPFLVIRPASKKPRAPGTKPGSKDRSSVRSELVLKSAWEGGDEAAPVSFEDAQSSGESLYPVELGLDRSPNAFLLARAEQGDELQVGLVSTLGEGVSGFQYLPEQEAVSVTWGRPLAAVPKAYARMARDPWEVVAGSYVVGFGQRLVFDETRRSQPDGLEVDDEVYGTMQYTAPRRLLGVAGSLALPVLEKQVLKTTAFVSIAPRDLYQYDFVLPGRVEAGADTTTPVYLEGARVYPVTLPNAYQERTLGAGTRLSLGRKSWLGMSAYYSWIAKSFNFTFTSGLPERSGFGAVGLEFGTELPAWQLSGEVAVTDQGAPAFLLRGEGDYDTLELLSVLYGYAPGFDNPHSRGTADSDTLDGKRDQDELGLRVRASWRPMKPLRLRALLHPFYRPEIDVWRLASEASVELLPIKGTAFTGWLAYKDKNLRMSGRGLNYTSGTAESYANLEDPDLLDDDDSDVQVQDPTLAELASEPNGARVDLALKVRSTAFQGLSLDAGLRRFYVDASYTYLNADCTADYGWQVGQDAWLRARYSLKRAGHISGRIRYLDEDVHGSSGVRQVQPWVQYEQAWGALALRFRYGATFALADPVSKVETFCVTAQGDPCNAESLSDGTLSDEAVALPVHALQAALELKF